MSNLEKIEAFCKNRNSKDWGDGTLNVYGTILQKGLMDSPGACYAMIFHSMRHWQRKEKEQVTNFFALYNGRRPGKRADWINHEYGRIGFYAMHESDRSVTPWLEFMLSPESPFKDINKYLVVKDPGWIAKNAMVFENFQTIDARQLYVYLIAMRQPYEFPAENALFEHLVLEGVSPKTAALASFYVMTQDSGKTFTKKMTDMHAAFARYGTSQIRHRWYNSSPRNTQLCSELLTSNYPYLSNSEVCFASEDVAAKLDRLPEMSLPQLVTFMEGKEV